MRPLVHGESRWTFRQLDEEVDRHAWALMKAGLGRGDRIGLWFTNRPCYIFLLLAISRLGAVAVPLNTRYRSRDMAYCLAQSECNALIYAERSGPVDYGALLAGGPSGSAATVGRWRPERFLSRAPPSHFRG